MKKAISVVLSVIMLLSMMLVFPVSAAEGDLVPDAVLAAAIRSSLGLDETAELTEDSLAQVENLSAFGDGQVISDFSGLEYCTALKSVDLMNLGITNDGLAQIVAKCPDLESLNVGYNAITDVSALASFSGDDLRLDGNDLSSADLSVIADLPLKVLSLSNAKISNIDSLAGLTNLELLNISVNSISDISVVANFAQLCEFDAKVNNISDLSALKGLDQLEIVCVMHNKINVNDPAQAEIISALVARGNISDEDFSHQEPDIGPVPGKEYLMGDVNFDGYVDSLDAVLVATYDAGVADFDAVQLVVADVNGDGFVDSLDAVSIAQCDAGLIDGFGTIVITD